MSAKAASLLLGLCLYLGVLPAGALEPLAPGKGRFVFPEGGDRTGQSVTPSVAPTVTHRVTVWYYKPAALTRTSRIVFVMHGTRRNGRSYRDHWVAYAEQYGFLLAVPEFSRRHFPRDAYQLGNVRDANPAHWSFAVLEHLFDALRARESLEAQRYSLYGHSAGAQFVHRHMLFMPAPRVDIAIAANAGAYTFPVYAVASGPAFPWALDRTLVTEAGLRAAFGRCLVVMLGEKDIDSRHSSLPRSRQAMAQGRDRLNRGQNFYRVAGEQAALLKTPFNWQQVIVPGVGHHDTGMARVAVKYLMEAPWQAVENRCADARVFDNECPPAGTRSAAP